MQDDLEDDSHPLAVWDQEYWQRLDASLDNERFSSEWLNFLSDHAVLPLDHTPCGALSADDTFDIDSQVVHANACSLVVDSNHTLSSLTAEVISPDVEMEPPALSSSPYTNGA